MRSHSRSWSCEARGRPGRLRIRPMPIGTCSGSSVSSIAGCGEGAGDQRHRSDSRNRSRTTTSSCSETRIEFGAGEAGRQAALDWSKEELTFAGTTYNPDRHSLGLIYPNPLNPRRYVVLNSGHTFHEPEFRASNAQLYPRLGDVEWCGSGRQTRIAIARRS